MARSTGMFGKLPVRGDFMSRRLDQGFLDSWDTWLQRAIAESRAKLGGQWLECYLSAPIWRFVIPKGVYSDSGCMGVMVPSVDRVGRYFPLTLAVQLPQGNIDLPATLLRAEAWFAQVEDLALEALTPQLNFEDFDRRLAESILPDDLPVLIVPNDDTVPIEVSKPGFHVRQHADGVTLAKIADNLKADLARVWGPYSLWMTYGGESVPCCIARCGELIDGNRFCAFLDGQWVDHGWILKSDTPAPVEKSEVAMMTVENPATAAFVAEPSAATMAAETSKKIVIETPVEVARKAALPQSSPEDLAGNTTMPQVEIAATKVEVDVANVKGDVANAKSGSKALDGDATPSQSIPSFGGGRAANRRRPCEDPTTGAGCSPYIRATALRADFANSRLQRRGFKAKLADELIQVLGKSRRIIRQPVCSKLSSTGLLLFECHAYRGLFPWVSNKRATHYGYDRSREPAATNF